jgi:hypothetical protein
MKVKGNSASAVADKVLRQKGLTPVYTTDSVGTYLYEIKDTNSYSGILCFVNGKEPGDASLPMQDIELKPGDKLSLCFVEQGVYKGDFAKNKRESVGLHPIFIDYDVREKDFQPQEYTILLD